jgi:hypothetical protein
MHCDDFVSLLFVIVIFPLFKTVELRFSGLIRTASHSDTQKIRIIGFYFESGLHWQFEVETISTNGCCKLHIYLRTDNTLIHY